MRPDGPMVPTPYRVTDRLEEVADTTTLVLEAETEPLPPPLPGQFNMLWAFGVGESAISVARYEAGLLFHTIRGVGAVTRALGAATPGDVLGVRGPFGSGWSLENARGKDVLILAGGLGTAPLRPLVDAVLADRSAYGVVTILLGARSPELLLYADEVATWRGRFDLDVEVTVDTADASWRGDVGVVTKLVDRARNDPSNTVAFVCGPELMMRFSAAALVDKGVAPEAVQLSLERNMECAVGHCGRCQLGPHFVCKDGPVLPWAGIEALLAVGDR